MARLWFLRRPLLVLAVAAVSLALVATAGWYRDRERVAHVRDQYDRNHAVMFSEVVDLSRRWSQVRLPADLTRTPCTMPNFCIGSWTSPKSKVALAAEIQATLRDAGLTPRLEAPTKYAWRITAKGDGGVLVADVATAAAGSGSLVTVSALPQRPPCRPGENAFATDCAPQP